MISKKQFVKEKSHQDFIINLLKEKNQALSLKEIYDEMEDHRRPKGKTPLKTLYSTIYRSKYIRKVYPHKYELNKLYK